MLLGSKKVALPWGEVTDWYSWDCMPAVVVRDLLTAALLPVTSHQRPVSHHDVIEATTEGDSNARLTAYLFQNARSRRSAPIDVALYAHPLFLRGSSKL